MLEPGELVGQETLEQELSGTEKKHEHQEMLRKAPPGP